MEMLTEDSSMAPLLTEYWNLGLSIQDSVNTAVLLSEPTPNLVPIYLQCNRCRECCGSGSAGIRIILTDPDSTYITVKYLDLFN
jgi:hypothetical protein